MPRQLESAPQTRNYDWKLPRILETGLQQRRGRTAGEHPHEIPEIKDREDLDVVVGERRGPGGVSRGQQQPTDAVPRAGARGRDASRRLVISPFSARCPYTAVSLSDSGSSCPLAASIPTAATSRTPATAPRSDAGARLTLTRWGG